MACLQWKVPVLPVKPWQMTLVSFHTAGGGGLVDEIDARDLVAAEMVCTRAQAAAKSCSSYYSLCGSRRVNPKFSWSDKGKKGGDQRFHGV